MTSNSTEIASCSGFIGQYMATNPNVSTYFAFYVINCVVNGLSAFTAIFGNLLLIMAIIKTPSLKKPSYWLITSQAFTDLFIGFTVQPLMSFIMMFEWREDFKMVCILGNSALFFSFFLLTVSGCGLTAISIDRLLAVRMRINYKNVVTFRRVASVLVIVWMSSLLIATFAILLQNHKTVTIVFLCFSVLCSFITSFSYINAFKDLRLHTSSESRAQAANNLRNKITPLPNTNENKRSTSFDIDKYGRSLRTMLLIELVFVISAIPISISWMYTFVTGIHQGSIMLMYSATTLLNLNSTINPLIYMTRMKDIGQACSSILKRN